MTLSTLILTSENVMARWLRREPPHLVGFRQDLELGQNIMNAQLTLIIESSNYMLHEAMSYIINCLLHETRALNMSPGNQEAKVLNLDHTETDVLRPEASFLLIACKRSSWKIKDGCWGLRIQPSSCINLKLPFLFLPINPFHLIQCPIYLASNKWC